MHSNHSQKGLQRLSGKRWQLTNSIAITFHFIQTDHGRQHAKSHSFGSSAAWRPHFEQPTGRATEIPRVDLSKPARDRLAADGVPIFADAKAAVQGASRHHHAARQPACGGLFLGGRPAGQHATQALIIDSSTIAAATSPQVAGAARDPGVAFIDAPVSAAPAGPLQTPSQPSWWAATQRRPGAAASCWKNGRQHLPACRQPWARMNGQICNNMLLGICRGGHHEAIALGVARPGPQGAERNHALLLRAATGQTGSTTFPGVMETAPASKGYAGGFGTDLMLKDLGLAQENAAAVKASYATGRLARNLYAMHSIAQQWCAGLLKHHQRRY